MKRKLIVKVSAVLLFVGLIAVLFYPCIRNAGKTQHQILAEELARLNNGKDWEYRMEKMKPIFARLAKYDGSITDIEISLSEYGVYDREDWPTALHLFINEDEMHFGRVTSLHETIPTLIVTYRDGDKFIECASEYHDDLDEEKARVFCEKKGAEMLSHFYSVTAKNCLSIDNLLAKYSL